MRAGPERLAAISAMVELAERANIGGPWTPAARDLLNELAAKEHELERLRKVLRMDQPYPLRDVVEQLAEAAEHLLFDHSCDAHGYEGVGQVVKAAREALADWDAT